MNQFIEEMRRMLNPPDDAVILQWLDLAENLSESSEFGIGFEKELREILLALKYVQHNFSAEVLQKSLRLCILNDEIINGAVSFNAGLTEAEVKGLAETGTLGYGYIPNTDTEQGTLTLIELNEPGTPLLLVYNEPEESLLRGIAMLSGLAEHRGYVLSELLTDRDISDIWMDKIEDGKLQKAYLKAFETTTAVGVFLKCSLSNHQITRICCHNLEEQTEEKRPPGTKERVEKEDKVFKQSL